jgi:hypothetical protein
MRKRRSEKDIEKLLADYTESLAGGTAEPSSDSVSEKISFSASEDDELSSLYETVQTVSSVVQPRQPSEEFVSRVSGAVQKRFREQISTEKLQRIIGMAITLEDFRKSLFRDVVAACRGAGFSLTPMEIAALRDLKEDAVNDFANSLDERITKFFPTNLP